MRATMDGMDAVLRLPLLDTGRAREERGRSHERRGDGLRGCQDEAQVVSLTRVPIPPTNPPPVIGVEARGHGRRERCVPWREPSPGGASPRR